MPAATCWRRTQEASFFYGILIMQLDLPGHKSEPCRSFVFAFAVVEAKSQAPSVVLQADSILSCHTSACQSRLTILHCVRYNMGGSLAASFVRITPAASGSLAASFVRITPAAGRFRSGRTACGILRFYSVGVGIAFSRSRLLFRLSCFSGSLWACSFLLGDPDGLRRS